MKVGNKTVNYSVYERSGEWPKKLADTTSIQLPSIEMLTDTIKGSGILGEIDWPSFCQPGSMTLAISVRVQNEDITYLAKPGAISLELRWVTDSFDSNNIKIGINAHKAFIKGVLKKLDEGKIEAGASGDGSYEYEVLYYKRVINGREVLMIDKINGDYIVNGVNFAKDVKAAL